jgi:hypothetical protein
MIIHLIPDGLGREGELSLEMGYLGEGMNACIGPARSLKLKSAKPQRVA